MMMKDCKPATLPDLPFAFVTNLQYNVGSKYQIIVVIVIVIILPHIIMSLYKYIPSSPEADTLCEPVPSMAPVQSIRTQGDQHNHMHRRQGTTYQDLMRCKEDPHQMAVQRLRLLTSFQTELLVRFPPPHQMGQSYTIEEAIEGK